MHEIVIHQNPMLQ